MTPPSDWCFPSGAVQFLTELKQNNNRDWFAQNKSRYDEDVKRPAQAYCTLMCEELSAITGTPHTSKIFRVHRDVRFSKDKTPYSAHLHISFLPDGSKGAAPAWFFALEPEKLIFGAGTFGFEKQALERFRERVTGGQGAALLKILSSLEEQGLRLSEPELKRVPRGFEADEDHAPLLRHKGLTAWRDSTSTKAATAPGLIDRSCDEYRTLLPLFTWLSQV